MTSVFLWWENSQTQCHSSRNGPFRTIQTRCNEVRISVNPDKNELIIFTRRRKLPGFFEPHFYRVTKSCSRSVMYLRVILGSWLTWREHVDVKVRKAHNMLWACGETWGLRLKAVHWLCFCHSAVHHFCILSMVAWVSDGWCQENTKQSTETCVLGGNGSDTHYSCWYYGGTYWPPSTRSGDSRCGKVRDMSLLSGM